MKQSRVVIAIACLTLASCGVGISPTAPAAPATTKYALTIVTSPSNGGSVTISPNQTEYAPGTVVTLTAIANSGYSFNGWSGTEKYPAINAITAPGVMPNLGNSPYNPETIVMSANKTVTANFKTN